MRLPIQPYNKGSRFRFLNIRVRSSDDTYKKDIRVLILSNILFCGVRCWDYCCPAAVLYYCSLAKIPKAHSNHIMYITVKNSFLRVTEVGAGG